MPIIIPSSSPDQNFYERLRSCGATTIDQEVASQQNVRPARLGILNLMPAAVMEDTELRWLWFMSHTVLQIEPVLIKFDNDQREQPGTSREEILKRYQPFSDVADKGLDGIIITGDNQERREDGCKQPFHELRYRNQLLEVMDWAKENVGASIFSCLSSHIALHHRYGIDREITPEKTLGVFTHKILHHSAIVDAMDDTITAPHSRWGNIPTELLESKGIRVVANSDQVGWLLAEDTSEAGTSTTYIQGHPEYLRYDLHAEYVRDAHNKPQNYYPDGDSAADPRLTWSNDARALFENWIRGIYAAYSLQS